MDKLTPWNDNNVVLTVDLNDNFAYRGNLEYTGFNGQVPSVNLNDSDGDGQAEIILTFNNPFNLSQTDSIGTITFDAVKTGSDHTQITGKLEYDDDLGSHYTGVESTSVEYLLEAALDVLVSPVLVDLTSDNLSWVYEVVNMGMGTAYNTYLTEELLEVLTYSDSTVDDNPANPVITDSPGYQTIRWDLGDIPPGQTRKIVVNAATSGSSADFDQASTAETSYGWKDISDNYYPIQIVSGNSGTDFPKFRKPTSSIFVKNDEVPAISLEDTGVLKIRVENNGKTDNYNLIITQELGTGFEYTPGSTKINGLTVSDPVISGTSLIWSFESFADLELLTPLDVCLIEYGVMTTEAFTTENVVTPTVTWQMPWDTGGVSRSGSTIGAQYSVPRKLPYITVNVSGMNLETDMEYSKDVTASLNEQVRWRVRISNTGTAIAKNMTLTNSLPTNMSFVSITPAPIGDNPSWNIGNIGVGQTVEYYVIGKFDGPCTDPDNYTASVSWGSQTSTLTSPGDNSDSANLITQPEIATVEQNITDFTTKDGHVVLTFTTTGAPIYNMEVQYNLLSRFAVADSPGLTYSGGLNTVAPSIEPIAGQTTLTWRWAGPIFAGVHTIDFDIQDFDSGASDSSVFEPELDITYENSSGIVRPTVNDIGSFTPKKANLVVNISEGLQVANNAEVVNWTITVRNTGNAPATNVEITDTLGDAYSNILPGSSPDETTGNVLQWNNRTINPGATLSFNLQATISSAGSHLKEITAIEWGHASQVCSDSINTLVAVFSFQKTVDQDTGNPDDQLADSAGEIVTFTINPNFQGEDPYQNITIRDILPEGLEFYDETVPGGVSSAHGGKNLCWTIDDFVGPNSPMITYRARIIKEGALTNGSMLSNEATASFEINVGTVYSFDHMIIPDKLEDTEDIVFYEPSISITSRTCTPDSGSNVTADQEITHTLIITNTGDSPGYQTRVCDTLPFGTRSFDPGSTLSVSKHDTEGNDLVLVQDTDYAINYDNVSGELNITFENTSCGILKKDEYHTITYKTEVNSDISAGVALLHKARVLEYYSQPMGTTGVVKYPASANQTVTFNTTDAQYSIYRVTPIDGQIRPGDTVAYRLRFTVPDGTSIYDINLENTLPPGLEFNVGTSSGPNTGTGGPDLGSPVPDVSGDIGTGQVLTWFTGDNVDISNNTGSDIIYQLEFSSTVREDIPEIVRGATLTTGMIFNFNSINDDELTRTDNSAVTDNLTVIEPTLVISKDITSTGSYQAGSLVTYQLTIEHTGESNSAAYDLVVSETLPTMMRLRDFEIIEGTLGEEVQTDDQHISWGETGNVDLDNDQRLVLNIEAELTTEVEPGQEIDFQTDLEWESINGVNLYERSYTDNLVASVTINDATDLNKAIHTLPTSGYTIGETFVYRIVLGVNEGTTDNVLIKDTLPSGVEFVSYDITKGVNISYSPLAQEPLVGQTGQIIWEFGRIINPDDGFEPDQIIIDYTVKIANLGVNQSGEERSSQAEVNYVDYADNLQTVSSDDVEFTIQEPEISVVQKVRNETKGDPDDYSSCSNPDAGDILQYRLVITNGTVNSSTAFDLNQVANLSEGLCYITDSMQEEHLGTVELDPQVSGTGDSGSPQMLVWGREQVPTRDVDLAAGETIIYTYKVRVLDQIAANQQLANSLELDWTSLDGEIVGERDGSEGTGGLNDYLESVVTIVNSADSNLLNITRSTDTFNPGTNDLRIGDIVTFRLNLDLQEGTTKDLTVISTLPEGLEFVNTVSINGDSSSPYESANGFSYDEIQDDHIPAAGDQNLYWSFGDLVNSGDNLVNDSLEIVYRAQVVKELAVTPAAQLLDVSANLDYTDKTTLPEVTKVNTQVEVRQPQLNVNITSSPADGTNIMANQKLKYTITVTNTGQGSAYDLQILNTIPSGLRQGGVDGITVLSCTIGGIDKVIKDPDDNPNYLTDGQLIWDLSDLNIDDYHIPASESLIIIYTLRSDGDLAEGDTVSSTAQVTAYYSLDDQDLPSEVMQEDRQQYAQTVTSSVNHHTISTPEALSIDLSGTGFIGEEIVYQLKIPGDGATVDTVLYDLQLDLDLPTGVEFVKAQFGSENQATGSLTSDLDDSQLTLTGIESIPANCRGIVDITVKIVNCQENTAGVQLPLSGSYSYELTESDNDDFGTGDVLNTDLIITEPELTILQEVRNQTEGDPDDFTTLTSPDAGDVLEYRVTINNTGINISSAYDLNIVDTLNKGLGYLAGSMEENYSGSQIAITPKVTGTGIDSAQIIHWGREADPNQRDIDLPENQTIVYTYKVKVLDSVSVLENLTNSIVLDWTSADGIVAGERDGSDGSGGLNDYRDTDSTMVQIPDDNTLSVEITDTFNSGVNDLRIGDLVTFELKVNLQEGTTGDLVVNSVLPEGLEFVDIISINGDLEAPYSQGGVFTYGIVDFAITPSADEQILTWTFGDITNSGDNDETNNELIIIYRGVVNEALDPAVVNQDLNVSSNIAYTGKATLPENTEIITTLEVNQPDLNINLAAEPSGDSNIMANQLIEYTVTVTNTGNAPAYDLLIVDTLPVGLREKGLIGITVKSITIAGVTKPAKDPESNINFTDDGRILWNLDDGATADTYTILPTEELILVFTARADSDLREGLVLSNSVSVEAYYSLDDDLSPGSSIRRQYSTPDAAVDHNTISTPGIPGITNPITGTIGEEILYQLQIPGDSNSEETLYDLEVEVTLPDNVEFIEADFAATNQAAGNLLSDLSGDTLKLTGIETVSIGTQAVIDLKVNIKNDAFNTQGTQFEITTNYTYELIDGGIDDFIGGTEISDSLTVIEPQLVIAQEARNVTKGDQNFEQITAPDAGDIIEYKVTLTNGTGNVSTAYDLNLIDNLNSGLKYVAGSLAQIYEGTTTQLVPEVVGTGETGSPQTISWGRDSLTPIYINLPMADQLTYLYQVEVMDQTTINQSLINTVSVDWTSRAGQIIGERDGSDGVGSVNDYTAAAITTVQTRDANSISLVRDTDTFNPGTNDLRIGDLVTLTMTVHLQEGTSQELILSSHLPVGMEFVKTVSINGDTEPPFTEAGVFSYSPITLLNTPNAGAADLIWDLGDVVNTADNHEVDDLVISYQVQVNDNLPDDSAVQLVEVEANLSYTGKTTMPESTLTGTELAIIQPELEAILTANPINGSNIMADQLITYALTITNVGTAPAYDLQVLNIIPEGLRQRGQTGIFVESIKINGLDRAIKYPETNANFDIDGRILWDFNDDQADTYTISPGEIMEIIYTIRADSSLTPGDILTTVGRVESYNSLDDDNLPPESTLADMAQYGSTLNQSITHNSISTPGFMTIGNPLSGTIGEELVYTVRIPGDSQLIDTDLYDLEVEFTLPDNIELLGVNYAIDNQASGDLRYNLVDDDLILQGIDLIPTNRQAVVELHVRIKNQELNRSGTEFVLHGEYTYELVQDGNDDFSVGDTESTPVTVVEPELVIDKSGPEWVSHNASANFTLSIVNNGQSTAWQPVIKDILPPEMRELEPRITGFWIGQPARELFELAPDDYDLSYNQETGEWVITLKSAAGYIDPGETLTLNYQADLNRQNYTNLTLTNTGMVTKYYSRNIDGGVTDDVRVYDQLGDEQTSEVDVKIQSPIITANILPDRVLARPGEMVHYSIQINNTGNIAADNLTLKIDLAAEFVAGSLTNLTTSSGVISIEEPTAGVNDTGTFTITQISLPAESGQVTINWDATLKSVLVDGTIIHNQSELNVPSLIDQIQLGSAGLTIASSPVLSMSKRDSFSESELSTGTLITYNMRIGNTGNENAVQAVLQDQIPANTTYVTGSTLVDGQILEDRNGEFPLADRVQLGRINVNQEIEVQFTVQVNPEVVSGTIITSQAFLTAYGEGTEGVDTEIIQILSDDPDTVLADDPTYSALGDLPILDAQKIVTDDNGGELEAGDVLTYKITVTNLGNAQATQVGLADTIPEETTYIAGTLQISGDNRMSTNSFKTQTVSRDPEGVVDGRDVRIALGNLNPAVSFEITYKVLVDFVPDEQIIISQGVVSCEELPDEKTDADGDDSNGDQPTEIAAGLVPVLRAIMQVSDLNGDNIKVGDLLEYSIQVRNIGSLEATDVVVKTALPTQLTYMADSTMVRGITVADTLAGGSQLEEGLNLGVLNAGQTINIRFRAAVSEDSGRTIDLQVVYQSGEGLTGVSDSDLDDGIDNQVSEFVLNNQELFAGIDANNIDIYLDDDDPTRIQIGSNPGTTNILGTVWLDDDHDNQLAANEQLCANWIVEIYQGNNLIASTMTNSAGLYRFRGLLPGNGYKLYYRNSTTQVASGIVQGLTLLSGTLDTRQNYPYEPTGIVYDAVTRQPVSGAEVWITGPAGFDAERDLLPGQQGQITGTAGHYRVDILDGAPEGNYTLRVVPPNTYSPQFPSTIIQPEEETLVINGGSEQVIEDSYLIVENNLPSTSDVDTTYFLTISHRSGNLKICNNHIPIDPVLEGAILLTKKANRQTVSIGEFVQYSIVIENQTTAVISNYFIQDMIPPGFKYVKDTARLDGQPCEPVVNETLLWEELSLEAGQTATLTYNLVVGTGVVEGNIYQNRVTAIHGLTDVVISNEAIADVRVIVDSRFSSSLVIGKVFNDLNGDGIQQEDENGLPGVKILTVSGQIITTDNKGLYHLVDELASNFSRGEDLLLKLDVSSLPEGYELTTENPVVISLTGIVQKVNFGVKSNTQ